MQSSENKGFVTFLRKHFKTTYEFKKAMDISWPTAKRWESWPALMSLPALFRLAELTGVPAGALVELIYLWQYGKNIKSSYYE